MQRLCRVLKENAPLFFSSLFFTFTSLKLCYYSHQHYRDISHTVSSQNWSCSFRDFVDFEPVPPKILTIYIFFFLSTFKISCRLLVFDPSYLSISFAAKQEKKQSNAPLVLGTLQANSFDRRRTFCNCPSGSTLSQSNSASANQRAELEVSNKCQF